MGMGMGMGIGQADVQDSHNRALVPSPALKREMRLHKDGMHLREDRQ
jgi:hypothetical protein